MDLKELDGWEGDLAQHWYYASKASALDTLLGELPIASIADIGAGSGFFTRHLLERRSEVRCATCVDVNYPAEREESIGGRPIRYRRTPRGVQAELYLLMDVLEHVEDDEGFLRELVAAAPAGARFAITVPAFQWLWSGHDAFLGHYRRYTLRQLAQLASRCGLTVDTQCYFFGALFPAAAAARLSRRLLPARPAASDMRPLPRAVDRLLRAVCRLEEKAFTRNRAFGLTAIVLASCERAVAKAA